MSNQYQELKGSTILYSTPQIRVSIGQIDMIYPADVTQHAGFPE